MTKLKNLLSESLVNSLNIQPGQVVSNPYHTAFKPMVEDETQDPQEIVVGNYQTRHYDMCPGATTLYKDIESKGVDMELAERTAKLQDVLFYMEKHVVKEMKRGTEEDVLMAKNLADQIMAMAEMMGLTDEHQYIQGHVDAIEKVVTGGESVNEANFKGKNWFFTTFSDGDIRGDIQVSKTATWKLTNAGNSLGIGGQFTLMDAGKVRGRVPFPKNGNLAQLAKRMYDTAQKETTYGVDKNIKEKDILDGLRGYYKAWASAK